MNLTKLNRTSKGLKTGFKTFLTVLGVLAGVVFSGVLKVPQSQSRSVLYGPTVIEEIKKNNLIHQKRKLSKNTESAAPVNISFSDSGTAELVSLSGFSGLDDGKYFGVAEQGEKVTFSFDPVLHQKAEELLKKFRVPWGALVAIEPSTGRVLALAGHSEMQPHESSFALKASFPAASLFKIVTGAAAVETSGLSAHSEIKFRGGNYTLSKGNYLPSDRLDRRAMSLAEAMAKSCNPAFARVALRNLDQSVLTQYAQGFGFNMSISSEFPLNRSSFDLPPDDYAFARTAAGFGDAFISPVHAAMLMSAIANGGTLFRPYIIESVEDAQGALMYQAESIALRDSVLQSTAHEVLDMMRDTARSGTAKRAFSRRNSSGISIPSIAAKTGTLSGSAPKGLYRWLVASAPLKNPEIVIASLVIDPGHARINGVELGRHFLEFYFANR